MHSLEFSNWCQFSTEDNLCAEISEPKSGDLCLTEERGNLKWRLHLNIHPKENFQLNLKEAYLSTNTNTDSWTHSLRGQTYSCWGVGSVRGFGMDMYTPLLLKWITNQDLLHSTGNSAQCFVAAWMGRESGGRMDTCGWLSPLLLTWSYRNIVNWLYSNTK